VHDVSIPSRRVGDPPLPKAVCPLSPGFHPLKAGRRLYDSYSHARQILSFHPLKAGRRLRCRQILHDLKRCFHPLKAGRRLVLYFFLISRR